MTRRTIVVSVRVTPELYRDLRRAALRDRRSLSDYSRLALHDAVKASQPHRDAR